MLLTINIMKNAIIILILFTVFISPVSASEITGTISTNPNILEPIVDGDIEDTSSGSRVSGGGSAFLLDNSTVETKHASSAPEDMGEEDVIVLGFNQYPDGTLIRGSDSKIYLIKNGYKKHIKTLEELAKYSGQVIFDANKEELGWYETREYLDGDLIRFAGDVKIYHVVDNDLEHVLNLEELRADFFGQEIFNLNLINN